MPEVLPFTLRLYRRVSGAASLLAPVLIKRRLRIGREDPARSNERRGIPSVTRPAGPLVWIHGASVGEVLAAAALIERLRAMNLRILLTSGTVSSGDIVAKRFPPDIIHQYIPYDSPRFVARFLTHWRPSLALFIESDLWPNLILGASAQKLPMVLINGRMSQRSFPRWQRMHGTISALLGRFETCLVQSDTDAERFAALGGRNIVNTGNLKLDVPAPPVDDLRLQMLKTAMRGRPIVIAASTHPGEDEIIIAAHRILLNYFPKLLTVIVPRHSARGEDIAALVSASGAKAALRSRGEMPDDTIGFYIGDTMGEMGLFFRLSPVVVMGGSLVPHGGQNPIEAIKLGAAIVHGPQVFNFTEVFAALDAAGGAKQVTDAETLAKQLGQWLANDEARQSCIDAGTAVVDHLGGALDRTMAALTPYLVQLRLELHADA